MKCWEYEPAPDLYHFVLSHYAQADVDRIAQLFCPPGLRPQGFISEPYVLLAYLKEGLISLNLAPPIGSEILPVENAAVSRNCSETAEHLVLKNLAADWLRAQGVSELEYEGGYEAGEFDVAAKDRSWIVECGASRASKVWQFLPECPTSKLVFFNRIGIAVFKAGAAEKAAEYIRVRDDHQREALKRMRPLL